MEKVMKKTIIVVLFGLITAGVVAIQMFLGNPIHDKPYSHFVQSVRSKKVDVVTVKENHIQYNVGEHKFQVVRPRGETGSIKELKENGISFSVEEKSIDILSPVTLLLFMIFLSLSSFLMWRCYIFVRRVLDNMRYMRNGPFDVITGGQSSGPKGGPGSPPSVDSGAKFFEPEKSDVKFKDIAGNDEAKDELQQVVDFLQDNKKYKKMGAKLPKGVILYGPSGTGKTMFAKAIAGESGVPFMYVSGSEFVEMYVGVGAARVRDMFNKARDNSPCVVFIDEIDAVGKRRSASGRDSERDQTLNQLLVEMDGFATSDSQVVIIAATNRLETLDEALLRPGRFDKHISVDLPDKEGRIKILNLHIANLPLLNSEINIARLAKKCVGFSGADLANVVNEAALIAVRDSLDEVDQNCLESAVEKVAYGSEMKSRKQDEKELENTAWHESGHAILGLVLDNNAEIDKVTIVPRSKSLGHVSFLSEEKHSTKSQLLNSICISLGGRIGEEIRFGDYTPGAVSDIRKATSIARKMVTRWGMSDLGLLNLDNISDGFRTHEMSDDMLKKIDAKIKGIVDGEYNRANKILKKNKKSLKLLSETLLDKETLTGQEVETLLADILVNLTGELVISKKDEKVED
tara:strand:+ start:6422 stop:8314 length:1893 start_codon:yes stop_codon:yes gene_type:complete